MELFQVNTDPKKKSRKEKEMPENSNIFFISLPNNIDFSIHAGFHNNSSF